MAKPPAKPKGEQLQKSREERLKDALKANLARRKAQARARSTDRDPGKTD